ncbi:MAG: hypothetical protein IPI62_14430 [Bacteroidetes bacterium]|nr:hypothetical protein [Bacteroidota bacterium]
MNPQKDLVVKSKKRMITFILILSLYLTFEFCKNVYEYVVDPELSFFVKMYSISINGALACVFGVLSGFLYKTLF